MVREQSASEHDPLTRTVGVRGEKKVSAGGMRGATTPPAAPLVSNLESRVYQIAKM